MMMKNLVMTLLLLAPCFCEVMVVVAFSQSSTLTTRRTCTDCCCTTQLQAAAKKAKKKGATTTASGTKGFGVTIAAGSNVETDRSKESRAFYEQFLEKLGAGDNLKRTALGYTPLVRMNGSGTTTVVDKLRGVVCTRDIAKGSDIINIPYELALNLGPEGDDPTLPAVLFLRDYCSVLNHDDDAGQRDTNTSPRQHYYRMLPPYQGTDCLGSTEFFSESALQALQAPLIVAETLARRTRTATRFQQDVAVDATFPLWIDGTTPVTAAHLQWAVWLITSRVLTVQGPPVESGPSYRLLIPYLDMCNHDRTSPHMLTGRAISGGQLRVVAGATVQAGDAVSICYGGGVAGNDRFVQDYGFLDAAGYDIVAQELLGKRRIREGAGAGRTVSAADRERSLDALRATTIRHDEEALLSEVDPAIRTAIQYRLGLKRALSKFMIIP
jgi:hypothetical protein